MVENGLIHSIDLISSKTKCDIQNDLVQRYKFSINKTKGETDSSLPYSLITKDNSSQYLKKKLIHQYNILNLPLSFFGIEIGDLLSKVRENRIKEYGETGVISTHKPLDDELSLMTSSICLIYLLVYTD